MLGEKYFKACTRGLDRFNTVLVRNDHRRVLTTISVRQSTKKLLAYALHSTTLELDGDVVLRSRSLQRVERQVAPDALG